MTNETQPAPATSERSTLGERGQRALDAAAAGLYVFPLHPGTKNMPAVKDWENEATRDPEKIMQWWAKRPYNLAIATLPSRLVVVDLDPLKPGAPELAEPYEGCKHGLQVFQRMADAAGEKFPLDTYRVQSPSIIHGSRVGSQHRQQRAIAVAGRLGASALSAGDQRRTATAMPSRVGDPR